MSELCWPVTSPPHSTIEPFNATTCTNYTCVDGKCVPKDNCLPGFGCIAGACCMCRAILLLFPHVFRMQSGRVRVLEIHPNTLGRVHAHPCTHMSAQRMYSSSMRICTHAFTHAHTYAQANTYTRTPTRTARYTASRSADKKCTVGTNGFGFCGTNCGNDCNDLCWARDIAFKSTNQCKNGGSGEDSSDCTGLSGNQKCCPCYAGGVGLRMFPRLH